MATAYTSILKLALPVTGELSNAWGDTVNDEITSMIEEAITGLATISSWTGASHTLTEANGATSEARCAILECSGAPGAAATVICPTASKLYVLNNAVTGGYAVTLKTSGGTGISVPNGKVMWLYCDGTNVVDAVTHLSSLTLSSPLSTANGGTGSTSTTFVDLTTNVTGTLPIANGGTGTTSTTFADLTTNVTGTLPIANGGTGTTSTTFANLTTNVTGTLPVANGGTGATTLTGILKGAGTSAFSAATVGTDYVAPGTATNFTAKQTFTGAAATLAAKLVNALETTTVSATAAAGTINYDITTQSVLYYTSNASGNWTINLRGNSSNTLNSLMAVGECVTVVFLATQGTTAYYNSTVRVDGSTVTPKWLNGATPAAGNASSVDAYTYTIVKTASATFTVFATQAQFA